MARSLHLTGIAEADRLLSEDANALLIGMLLDQQVPLEKAFLGPWVIAQRLGGRLDVAAIAAMDPEEFAELCRRPPAVHRFPKAMAGRIQELCRILVRDWQGSAEAALTSAHTGPELKRLLAALPGFGATKSTILVALLGKQYAITPPGWEVAAGEFAEPGYRSVADIVDHDSLLEVRAAKRERKAAQG